MPLILWLATLLGSLFAGLLEFLAKYLTKKLAVVAAVVTAIGVVSTVFFGAIYALVLSIAYQLPDEMILGLSLVIPTNSVTCLSSIMTAHLLKWVYDWNVKVIQYRLF